LWIAFIVPNPTDFQYTIFRIVVALAGAAFAALIPGSIDVKYRGAIRAGGAAAVLIIIYFFTAAPPTKIDVAKDAPTQDIKVTGDCNVIGNSGSINCKNTDYK